MMNIILSASIKFGWEKKANKFNIRNRKLAQGFRLQTATTLPSDAINTGANDEAAIISKLDPSPSIIPCGDRLDRIVMSMVIPAVINFAMFPLVGAIDTFWVGRMKQALALAGQGAANRVFSSAFWMISFLPTIITPYITSAAAANDQEALQTHVSDALILGVLLGLFGTFLMIAFPKYVLRLVIANDSPAMIYAQPYLVVRGLTFVPALLATVGFSVFRGKMDVVTPLKIAVVSNLANIVLDPIFIFKFKLGVAGAAAATCASELISCILFLCSMGKSGLLSMQKLLRIPSFESLKPLLLGSISVLLRSLALEVIYLSLMNRSHALDKTGIMAASHAISMQLWDIGAFLLYAVGVVATVIVPSEYTKAKHEADSSPLSAARRGKFVAERLMMWGAGMGALLSILHLCGLPMLKFLTPLPAIQQTAFWPSVVGGLMHVICGVVYVGEGIQMGNLYFRSLAIATVGSTFVLLLSLKLIGNSLVGVWLSLGIMFFTRLIATLRHHFYEGPFAFKNIK
jgi:multidrug resistance protein, MATE family